MNATAVQSKSEAATEREQIQPLPVSSAFPLCNPVSSVVKILAFHCRAADAVH